MKAESDAELLALVRSGDTKATEALLHKYEQRIYRFGLRMCGNEDDARDVLQETLLSAFKNLATFRGDSRLSTWLYQVARSFCLKQRRLREGEPSEFEDVAPIAHQLASDSAGGDDRAHAREIGALIQAAVGTLGLPYREALILRDVEGLSAEDVAAVVGIEVGALKSRLHRARFALKQQLAAVLDETPDDGTGCPELAQELSAYAASEIDQAACETIERHLAGCARCTQACESLKRTVSLCRALPGGEVPVAVRNAVRNALRRAGAVFPEAAAVPRDD